MRTPDPDLQSQVAKHGDSLQASSNRLFTQQPYSRAAALLGQGTLSLDT